MELIASLPMTITEALVAPSLESSNNGVTFTITYGSDDGNVPLFVCNHLPATSTLTSYEASTVMCGNAIGGNFYVGASDPIAHYATEYDMEDAIRGIHGFGNVEVTRSEADGQGGNTYLVTFIEDSGDTLLLHASNSLKGKGATVSVAEVTKGNKLGGTYSLILGAEHTADLPFDTPDDAIKTALEGLSMIGYVDVDSVGPIDSRENFCHYIERPRSWCRRTIIHRHFRVNWHWWSH